MANCCTECFLDEYLKERIKEEGALGKCDFCNSENVYVIEPEDLRGYFDPLVNLYSAQVEFYPVELLKECEGRFIWEILSEDWEVFEDWEVGRQIIQEMYRSIDPHDERPLFLDNYVDSEDEFYGTDEELSDKLKKEWDEFCDEIKHKNRFFPQRQLDSELIIEILAFSEETISRGEFLYRARLSTEETKFTADKMGKPSTDKAVEGRANPVGISYLYLASDSDTAISEIRPQVENKVTVGKFRVNDRIKVVDLRDPMIDSPFKWGDNLEFVLKVQGFLRMLGLILSKPVDKNKTTLEYLPTQYLCEFIKNKGFEGVLYKSFLGNGHNVVFFDECKIECIETKLHKVTLVRTQSEEVAPPIPPV